MQEKSKREIFRHIDVWESDRPQRERHWWQGSRILDRTQLRAKLRSEFTRKTSRRRGIEQLVIISSLCGLNIHAWGNISWVRWATQQPKYQYLTICSSSQKLPPLPATYLSLFNYDVLLPAYNQVVITTNFIKIKSESHQCCYAAIKSDKLLHILFMCILICMWSHSSMLPSSYLDQLMWRFTFCEAEGPTWYRKGSSRCCGTVTPPSRSSGIAVHAEPKHRRSNSVGASLS